MPGEVYIEPGRPSNDRHGGSAKLILTIGEAVISISNEVTHHMDKCFAVWLKVSLCMMHQIYNFAGLSIAVGT